MSTNSLTALGLARLIREKTLSVREVVQMHLERLDAVNPGLNAVVQFDPAGSLLAADRADALLREGHPVGPLHGVPFTVKDCLEMAGWISTSGTPGRAAFRPKESATVVRRLETAGAIVIGRTNCAELCFSFETDNPIYGRTNNPYDLALTPGGSSGGEAAAIASGISAFGVGSDAGGSVRIPAHFCGLAGIRPTTGRVSGAGFFPAMHGLLEITNAIGPIARSVDDVATVLGIIGGVDLRDPLTQPMPATMPPSEIGGLRVGILETNGVVPPTDETRYALAAAAKALGDAGCAIDIYSPAGMADLAELFVLLYGADSGAAIHKMLALSGTSAAGPALSQFLDVLATIRLSVADVMTMIDRWSELRRSMARIWADFDLILSPVNAQPAFRHGETFAALNSFSYTYCISLLGWPAATVRAGASAAGLPIGVQIIAPPWRDDLALAGARIIERALGGYRPPPELAP
jgi:amidase